MQCILFDLVLRYTEHRRNLDLIHYVTHSTYANSSGPETNYCGCFLTGRENANSS